MADIVTAAFEDKHDYPPSAQSQEFFDRLLTENVDTAMFLFTSVAVETLRAKIEELVPEAKGWYKPTGSRTYGVPYAKYNDRFYENQATASSLLGAIGGKKPQIKIPVYITDSLFGINLHTTGYPNFPLAEGALSGDTDIIALAFDRIMRHKGGGFSQNIKLKNFDVTPLFDGRLGLTENPLGDLTDEETTQYLMSLIDSVEIRFIASEASEDTNEDSLKRIRSLTHSCKLFLYVVINVPEEVSKYITQSYNSDPRLMVQWFRQWYDVTLAQGGDLPGNMRDLKQIISDTQQIREVRLTNEHDLTTSFEGQTQYLPSITELTEYDKYMSQLADIAITKGGAFDPLAKLFEQENLKKFPTPPKNKLLYTDWRLNKASYVTTTGTLRLIDLNGWKPAPVGAFATMLGTHITDNVVSATLSDLSKIVKKYGKTLADFMELEDFTLLVRKDQRESYRQLSSVDAAFAFLSSIRVSWQWPADAKRVENVYPMIMEVRAACLKLADAAGESVVELYGDDFDYEQARSTFNVRTIFDFPMLSFIKRATDFVHEQVKGNYSELFEEYGVQRVMNIAPVFITIAKTADVSDVIKADKESRAQYLQPKLNDEYSPEPVPNIKQDFAFLPHQVKADNHLKNEADNVVANIAPGGGKTLLAITSALRALAKGRRVAIICPNYLMKNYHEDAMFLTEGKLNIVSVDNAIYSRYGEEALHRLIMKAPTNTLTLIGLTVFSVGKNINYSYNGEDIVINQIVEFLRSIEWDEVYIDESHYLANSSSNRSGTVARFLGGVKKVRLMSGTFINSGIMDALGQSRLMDPSALGTTEDFLEKYALQTSNNKITLAKPQAELHVSQRLKSKVDYINIRRKEWVALLPERRETFHFVNLSENQQRVYQSILDEVIKEIEADSNIAGKLKSGNEEDADNLEAYLKRYLARVERYLAACSTDELGSRMLKDEDLISPKSHKVNEILGRHFGSAESSGGKVLIFTSYKDSAKAIYDNLAPEFKKMAIHYEAERKDELIPIMKKDPNVKIVVGVEHSLNTGHNFQAFNRVIRIETVWNPGTLDQAESRINRPDPKNTEAERPYIYFDWVCCDSTIDITKTGRLISKLLSAVKFDEANNVLYKDLPDLQVVSMTFDNIRESNSFETALKPYIEGYRQYQVAQKTDFAEYKAKTKHLKPVAVPVGETIKGSAFLNVPYIANMTLPYQGDLGLVNIGDYAMDRKLSVTALPKEELKGKRVHTEYGDGVITNASSYSITVELEGGRKVNVDKLCAFLIPSTLKGTVRQNIERKVGLQIVDVPEEVEETITKKAEQEVRNPARKKEPVPTIDVEKNTEVEVFLSIINGALGVLISKDDPDATPRLMKKVGMTEVGAYYYAHCKTYKHLDQMINALTSKFDIPEKLVDELESLLEAFSQGRNKLFNVDQIDQTEIIDFIRGQNKRSAKGELKVYPLIQDGDFYLIAWADTQVEAKRLPRLNVPGVKWILDDGFYMKLFTRKTQARDFIKSLPEQGITISNMAEVKEEYKAIKL